MRSAPLTQKMTEENKVAHKAALAHDERIWVQIPSRFCRTKQPVTTTFDVACANLERTRRGRGALVHPM